MIIVRFLCSLGVSSEYYESVDGLDAFENINWYHLVQIESQAYVLCIVESP